MDGWADGNDNDKWRGPKEAKEEEESEQEGSIKGRKVSNLDNNNLGM